MASTSTLAFYVDIMDNCAVSCAKKRIIVFQSSHLQRHGASINALQLARAEFLKEKSVTSTLRFQAGKNWIVNGGGWCLRATSQSSTGTLGDDNESQDAVQATIEKSKKVLEVQKHLLHRIEERRILLSSLKDSLLNQDDTSYMGDESATGDERTYVEDSNGIIPGTYKDSKVDEVQDTSPHRTSGKLIYAKDSNGITQGGYDASKVDEVQEASPDPSNSSSIGDYHERAKSSDKTGVYTETDTKPGMVVLQGVRPPSHSTNTFDLDEVRLPRVIDKTELVEEDVKSPPLAGTNVMNIVLVTAECAPWSKTGGLGDVASALPKALARRGHRVMVVAPRYGNYSEAQDTGVRRSYRVDKQSMEVAYYQAYVDGVDFVFVHSNMFQNVGNNIYGGNRMDILKRMILFCKASIEVPWHVPCGGICYGDANLVFMANDWHTSLLPVYLKAYYHDNGLMKFARSLLVIHNIAHQGRGPMHDFSLLDLPDHHKHLFELYDPVGGEHLNIFAAGLKTAHRVVTVSHGYARELKTPEGGWGLNGIINENHWKLSGIVNGIDTDEWNPELDTHLKSDGYSNYSSETVDAGKASCKAALQTELGLPVLEEVPMVGFIGRLDHQKGVDLIAEAVPWLVGQGAQLVMLGAGRHDLENLLRGFESRHHDQVRGWVGFSVRTAHRITAGVDVLLMPSRFEPCGLNQLYAMRYGTVPVVHAVGGLRDTVQPFDPFGESGLGWTFDRAEVGRMIHALGNCFLTYREYKKSWKGLQKRGMMLELSWDTAAQRYEDALLAAKFQW